LLHSSASSGLHGVQVDAKIIETLVRDGYIPVLATVASSPAGESLNVNADIAAGEVRALQFRTDSKHLT
jgi:acetylglutamate kinase